MHPGLHVAPTACHHCGQVYSGRDGHLCGAPFWTEADAAAERADDAAYARSLAGEGGELPDPPAPTPMGALPPRPVVARAPDLSAPYPKVSQTPSR